MAIIGIFLIISRYLRLTEQAIYFDAKPPF